MCLVSAVSVHRGALALFPVGLRRPYPGRGQDSSHEMRRLDNSMDKIGFRIVQMISVRLLTPDIGSSSPFDRELGLRLLAVSLDVGYRGGT